jgi:uncharacterized protein YjbI with pentapeptide repeats
MKILKPDDLALVYRSLRFAGRNMLSLGMIAGFRMTTDRTVAMMSEPQLWAAVAGALGADKILDEGFPKPSAEYLVYAAACAPVSSEVEQMRVSAHVGAMKKSLIVSGDRHFDRIGQISAARPYTRMPITPATAFGGEGCPDNPQGKGFVELVTAEGTRCWPLPNVESERHRIASRGERTGPAGFWPMDVTSPMRQRHFGKFDDRWLREDWPGLPSDTQLECFLTAPEDQRLSGFFLGGERFVLENMHPVNRALEGTLPPLRARCFIKAAGGSLSELGARAETVWLFPEHEFGVVLYRAVADVSDPDAEEVTHVMTAWEPMDIARLSFDHYLDAFRAQTEAVLTALPPQEDPVTDAAPSAAVSAVQATVPVALDASAFDVVKAQAAELDRHTNALLAKHGTTRAQAEAWLPDTLPESELSFAEIQIKVDELNAQTRAVMKKHGLTDADVERYTNQSEPEANAADLPRLIARLQAETRQRLEDSGLSEADVMRELRSRPELAETLSSLAPPGVVSGADFAALAALAAKPPAPVSAALAAPDIAMPAADTPAVVQLTRDDVIARHAARASLAGYDLSNIDLSKLDLSGADFTGAILDKASFKGSRLADANFTQALLPDADFSECDLQRARFTKASASKSVFAEADLQGARLSDGDFTGADLSAAKLMNADLSRAIFDQAKLTGVDASMCRAESAGFTGSDLSAANFHGANLKAASFSGSRLSAGDFSSSACRDAEFYGADASQTQFADADLSHSRADAKTCFDDARFTRTRLDRAAWEGVQIRRASFERAVIDHADLSHAQAQATRFGASSAKGARLDKADLSGADLDGVDLFGGSLRRAALEGARLRHANLYGVNFDGTQPSIASLEGSNIDRTILQFRPPVI